MAFPAEYWGNNFSCEPAQNLIHHSIPRWQGPELRLLRGGEKPVPKDVRDWASALRTLKVFDLPVPGTWKELGPLRGGGDKTFLFEKDFGPKLGILDLNILTKVDEIDFVEKLYPIYKSIKRVSEDDLVKNKNLIGFVGAPWTLLVYMINKHSPKNKLIKDFFKDEFLINRILIILEKFLKLHIDQQIRNGATVIQIFDSWAGLLERKDLPKYVYIPTLNLVDYVKSLNVPVICFPRGIKDYKNYCDIVKPDVINIDYDVDPISICKKINIPIQGGLDPQVLLTDTKVLKKQALKYLDIFKDHPYIFNLGHGVLPKTNPDMVDYLVKMVKDY